MKIFFVIPPHVHYIEPYAYIQADKSNRIRLHLGLLYVAAELRRAAGITPRIIDLNLDDAPLDAFGALLAQEKPDIIGFSVLTFNLLNCLETCRIIRKASPQTKICFGGIHPTLYPEETLGLGLADYIVMGEGERTFCELVAAVASQDEPRLAAVRGIGYRTKEGSVRLNPPREPVRDLDELPFPAYDLIDIKRYSNLLSSSGQSITVMTSRGCPYKCIFCDIRQSGYRYRSPQNILQEIKSFVGMGLREFFIQDDNFTLHRARAKELCRLLIEADLGISYKISARVDHLDDELMGCLKRSGCQTIYFGVESGSQPMLDYLQKGITVDKVRTAFGLARKHGLDSCAYIMIGIPAETRGDIAKTLELVAEIKPRHLQCSVCTPMPRTYLYNKLLEEGAIQSDYWLEFARHPDPAFKTPFASRDFAPEELRRMQDQIQKRFYFSPRIILKEMMATRSLRQYLLKAKYALRMLID